MQSLNPRLIRAGVRLDVKFALIEQFGTDLAGQSESVFVRLIRNQTRASDRSSMKVLLIKKIQEETGPIYGTIYPNFLR